MIKSILSNGFEKNKEFFDEAIKNIIFKVIKQ